MRAVPLQETSPVRHPRYVTVLRFAFAALLLVAGLAKIADFPGFVGVVATYRALPELLLAPAALALTLTELALGAWLLWGHRLPEAAIAIVVLHLGYLSWLAMAYLRGLDLPNCGCLGVFWPRALTAWTFVEDGVLLALALGLHLGTRGVTPRQAGVARRSMGRERGVIR